VVTLGVVSVLGRLLVVALAVVLGGLLVMLGRFLVMLGGFGVVLGRGVLCHDSGSCLLDMSPAGGTSASVRRASRLSSAVTT